VSAKTEQAMAEIERQIARTRARLGQTLDTMADELAPRHLVEQGVDMVTDFLSANRSDGTSFGAALRADPVPLALIGFGVAWLAAENLGLFGMTGGAEHEAEPGQPAPPAERISGRAEPAFAGQDSGGKGWMHRAAGAAQDAVWSIVADSGAALGRAGDYLGKALPAGPSAGRAGGGWLRAPGRNPLLVGALGLAAGALAAVLLPATRREREIVGEARADLWEKAEELGHRAADGVRSLADSPARSGPGG
jgi:uncharacterized protein DUF3618